MDINMISECLHRSVRYHFQIVPRLDPGSDCCALLNRRENAAVIKYAYIVEFSVVRGTDLHCEVFGGT